MSGRKVVTEQKIWVVDRRTTRRYFLFNPNLGGRVEQLFWYCLAYCAAKFGIVVHAAVLMGTHVHLVYTDPNGQQPFFKAEFHRLLALGIKALRGWPEEVFNKSKGGEHEPLTPKALLKAIAYLIANPTAAFAVRRSSDWPGAKVRPEDIGTLVVRVKRPACFFDADNPQWPEVLELRIEMPQWLEAEYGADEARRLIAEEVARLEREALGKSKKRGIAFKGVRRILRTPHTARARSYEVFGKINPRFSAAGDREAARQWLRKQRQFNADYDEALAKWQAGDRSAVFPHGTWWMRVHHKVRCRPPP